MAVGSLILFWTLLEGMRFVDLPLGDKIAALRFIFVGLVLILLMAFRPQGVFGKRRRWCSVSEATVAERRRRTGARCSRSTGVYKRFGGIRAVDGADVRRRRAARSRR